MYKAYAIAGFLYILSYVAFFRKIIVAVIAEKSFNKTYIEKMLKDVKFIENCNIVGALSLLAAVVLTIRIVWEYV